MLQLHLKECRIILLHFVFFALVFSAKSQNNCPLNIRVTTAVGTCYNNCGIHIDLVDGSGELLDSNATDLSNIKYYCINQATNDTSYSYLSNFTVAPGTYKVGVQAACHYSYTNPDSAYIMLDKFEVVTTTTSYVTPVLSMINNTATSPTNYGTVPSFTCRNTGRVQLKITGGTFPYYVKVCDEDDNPIDTLVFTEPMYSGTTITRYDNKDYFSIENMAPGKYYFYVWDACDYHLPKVWQTVGTVTSPYISEVCWYNSSDSFLDSNVVKLSLTITKPNNYYASAVSDVIEYRLIYPEINGVSDTTAWRHLPENDYTSITSVTIHDTARYANAYCDMYGKQFKVQSRTNACEENLKTFTYTLNLPARSYYEKYSEVIADSSSVVEREYDSCGYWSARETKYGYPRYRICYGYGRSASSTTCWYNSAYYKHYYSYPLYWVYKDTLTGNVIKIDTVSKITTSSYLRGEDVAPMYGDYKTSSYTIPVRRTLYDGKGCELYSTFDTLRFGPIISTSGGTRYNRYLTTGSSYDNSDHCCQYTRNFYFYEENYPPMSYNGDCTVELISSPGNNKYNFTSTYSQATGQWTTVKDSLSNLATITLLTSRIRVSISDYCLPSGQYTFRVTIPSCTTYVYTVRVSFPDSYEYERTEEPMYELTPNCTELMVKPVAGSYLLHKSNTYNYGTNVNQTWTTTTSVQPWYQVVSGPTGGYSSTAIQKDGQLRFTMPGTYVVRMYPYGSNKASCTVEDVYDTIRFNGGTVEYKYDIAYVCDSISTTGFVRIKGKNGTEPYTYTLYSGPELTGTILGQNTTGYFDDVPIRDGQQISVRIEDACMASFPVSFYVFDLQKADKCWFMDGAKTQETCEGTYVNVYALSMEEVVTYEWEGPNGFHANTKDAQIFIPRGAVSGWYKVTLYNTGCVYPVSDSIYLSVIPAPSVHIAEDASVCPGQSVSLTYTTSGDGDVNYQIGYEANGVVSYQSYTNNSGYTYQPTSSGKFWVNEVSDSRCRYTAPEDTVSITLKDKIANSCDVITIPDSICIHNDATVYAYSTLETPYTIRWYSDVEQTNLIKSEVLNSETDRSSYDFLTLSKDTTVFVTVSNDEYCESQYGTIMKWMNMKSGNSSLRCGESMRFYDSGGNSGTYARNENYIHTFTATDNNPLTLTFTKFYTESTKDKLLIFTGNTTSMDSLLAEVSGNKNSSIPGPFVSNGGNLTVWFLSNGATQYAGWEATVSNNAKPAAVNADVTDSVKVSLSPITALPVHYDGDVTFQAIGTGGRGVQYEYVWETSLDNTTWTPWLTETRDTSRPTLTNLTQSTYVRVSVTDKSPNACVGTDTAIYYLPISNIKLSLNMELVQAYHCSSDYFGTLQVRNTGTGNADDVVVKLNLPADCTLLDGATENWNVGSLAAGETKSDTFHFQLNTTFTVPTDISAKAQIWSCLQGDSIQSVVYGDWDWTGTPRQNDEAMATLNVLPVYPAGSYAISTYNDTVCSLFDAQLAASSTIAAPQYFNWYADAAMTDYLKTDTVLTPGTKSVMEIPTPIVNRTYYVAVGTNDYCPTSDNVRAVELKVIEPNVGNTIVSTNDTVCYDNMALLTATSTLGYPQYYNWWKSDKTTLLKRDTVTEGNYSMFRPEHQIKDSIYYVSVYNDTTCPYLAAHNTTRYSREYSEFLMTTGKANGTTIVHSTDSIGFFDEGGKTANYRTHNVNFYHIFKAEDEEQVMLVLTAFDSEGSNCDWMKIYDGTSTSGTQLAFLCGNMTSSMPKTYTSTTGALTIQWKTDGSQVRSGWEGVITTRQTMAYSKLLAVSNVSIKSPILASTITASNDTVCYDNTAYLTASSEIGFPQYYTWWKADGSTLLKRDTVTAGNISHFNPEHQISDSLYYVHVSNDTTCPFVPGVLYKNNRVLRPEFRLNTSPVDTTFISCEDSIPFYDNGGKNGDVTTNSRYFRIFKAPVGQQVVIRIDTLNLINNTSYKLNIYDGKNTSGTLLASLYGVKSNLTYTSTTGYIFMNWSSYAGYMGWEGSITTDCRDVYMAESQVAIKSANAGKTITSTNDTVCYDNTALLTATSTLGYPQYYSWWKNDGITLLKQDTVTEGNYSTFRPEHQIQDSVYYISVYNDTTCPYFAQDTIRYNHYSEFLMTPDKANGTTIVHKTDSIGFFDEGGKSADYSTYNADYYHTFKAEDGKQVVLTLTAFNSESTSYDWMKIYDGTSTSGTRLAFLGGNLTSSMPKTYTSTTGSLTVQWKTDGSTNRSGWEGTITTNDFSATSSQLAVSHVAIKSPNLARNITTTNDTVCYDNTALLTATSTLGYPQYYNWWKNDRITLLKRDTVTAGNYSTFSPEHQIKDSIYYISVYNDTTCPYLPDVHYVEVPMRTMMLMNSTQTTPYRTTTLSPSDTISFYDDGGATGVTIGSTSTYYYETFTANEGAQVVLHIDTLALPVNSRYSLNIYNGTTASTLLANVYGTGKHDLTYVSTTGSLTLTLRSAPGYYGWKGYVTTDKEANILKNTSKVSIYDAIAPSVVLQETCQSVTPYTYQGFKDIDVSTAGTYTIDSTFRSVHGCDSAVTLTLTVYPIYNLTETATICANSFPYVWRDTTFAEGTTTGNYVFHRHSVHGCDSVVTLALTVNPTVAITTTTYTVCPNVGTQTLTADLSNVNADYQTTWQFNGGTPTEHTGISALTTSDSYDIIVPNTSCNEDYLYTINYLDANGCQQTKTDTVKVRVEGALTITGGTNSRTIECAAEAVAPHTLSPSVMPSVVDACGQTVSAHSSFTTPTAVSCEGDMDYVYTFTDCNGNTGTWTFTYHLDRTHTPVVNATGFANAATVTCVNLANALPASNVPTATDVCGNIINGVLTEVTDVPDPLTCSGTRRLTYSYYDCSGLSNTWVFTYTIRDSVKPAIAADVISTIAAEVSNCEYSVPSVVDQVRMKSSDNCTAREDLTITQLPTAGTTIPQTDAAQSVDVVVTVSDACGNDSLIHVAVTVPARLHAEITASTTESCLTNDGTATVSATGGTPFEAGGITFYYYSWSNGQSTATATGLSAGKYYVTVTDDHDCQAVDSVNITLYNPYDTLSISNITLPAICSGGSFDVVPSFMPTGTTYSWSAPVNANLSGLASGTNEHSIFGTLDNISAVQQSAVYVVEPKIGACPGSSFTVSIDVNVTINPDVNAHLSNVEVCPGENPTLTANFSQIYSTHNLVWKFDGVAFAKDSAVAAPTDHAETITKVYDMSAYTTCRDTIPYSVTYDDESGCHTDVSATVIVRIPTWSIPSAILTENITCVADALPPHTRADITMPIVKDGCDNVLSYTASSPVVNRTRNNDCRDTITFTYTYVACDNSSNDWQYVYYVADETAPTFTRPADITLYKSATCDFTADTAVTHSVPTAVADNCSNLSDIQISYVDVDVTSATDCMGKTILKRTWTATDLCGNNSLPQDQIITILDTIRPTFVVPSDLTIYKDGDCNYDASVTVTGDVVVKSDNCSDMAHITAAFTDVETAGTCEGELVITRTWTVTDDCGNVSAPLIQTITVVDTIKPTFTRPADYVAYKDATCNAQTTPAVAGEPIHVMDNCTTAPTVTYRDESMVEDCIGGYHFNRIWRVADDCGNVAVNDSVQRITVLDTVRPTIGDDNLNRELTSINCSFTVPDLTAEVRAISSDNCTDNAHLTITQDFEIGSVVPVGSSVTVTVQVADDCGNTSTKQIELTTPTALSVGVNPPAQTICYAENVTLTAEVTGGKAAYAYTWNTMETSATITVTPTATTTYSVAVLDFNGCRDTAYATITVKPASLNMDDKEAYIRCNGDAFFVTPTGAAIPANTKYVWTVDPNVNVTGQSEQTTPVAAPISQTLNNTSTALQTVVYHVTPITDGCSGDEFTITVSIEPTPVLTLNCPADIKDTLEFGSCALLLNPADLGTPTWAHSLGWVLVNVTNNAPVDGMYPEGDNVVTWTMKDECGNTVSCEQHVVVIFPECPDAVDYEGNVYHGIRIDCDCWTQRNLESTKYSDGSDIPGVYNYYALEHPNVDDNVNTFGRLYDWNSAIKDTADNGYGHVQGICPEGWYLPTAEKYISLNTHGANALKSPNYWLDGGGDNSTGFTSLPAGYYDGSIDRYLNLLGEAYYWSTTQVDGNWTASAVSLGLYCNDVVKTSTNKGLGYSIRCIKEKE